MCAAKCVANRFNEPALVLDDLNVLRESEAPKGQVYLEKGRPEEGFFAQPIPLGKQSVSQIRRVVKMLAPMLRFFKRWIEVTVDAASPFAERVFLEKTNGIHIAQAFAKSIGLKTIRPSGAGKSGNLDQDGVHYTVVGRTTLLKTEAVNEWLENHCQRDCVPATTHQIRVKAGGRLTKKVLKATSLKIISPQQ